MTSIQDGRFIGPNDIRAAWKAVCESGQVAAPPQAMETLGQLVVAQAVAVAARGGAASAETDKDESTEEK